jgi:hypothetical protein
MHAFKVLKADHYLFSAIVVVAFGIVTGVKDIVH